MHTYEQVHRGAACLVDATGVHATVARSLSDYQNIAFALGRSRFEMHEICMNVYIYILIGL